MLSNLYGVERSEEFLGRIRHFFKFQTHLYFLLSRQKGWRFCQDV